MSRYELLGVPVDRMEPGDFTEWFVSKAKAGTGGYVCVPNVQQSVLAHDEPAFLKVLQGADRVVPDSTILQRFVARRHGLARVSVLRGDQLTVEICRRASKEGVAVALVGGKNDRVLQKMSDALIEQCPGLAISFACSPPFREPTAEEENKLVSDIKESGAQIVFVGLGGPKQERWMARHTRKLENAMLIGVGAAFDWLSGEVKTSPGWVHGAGLEWLHRLISEPRRLGRRYLTTSPRFLWLYFFGSRRGLRTSD